MALEVGQLVTPSLRIVQRLGAGGMGSVWIADHLTLQTQVVVKIMSPELANNAEAVARFKAEASAAADILPSRRSGLPTLPTKRVSPVKIASGASPLFGPKT